MDRLTECITELEKAGLDVFDVGCRWQEKAPLTLSEKSEVMAGIFVLIGSALLLYMLNEIARSYLRPPSN